MKLIVTGGRNYDDIEMIYSVLEAFKPSLIIEGGCETGADLHARNFALFNGVPNSTYHADWKNKGRSAGPIRNKLMCEQNKDAVIVAFPGGNGTKDCTEKGLKLGMRVYKVGR